MITRFDNTQQDNNYNLNTLDQHIYQDLTTIYKFFKRKLYLIQLILHPQTHPQTQNQLSIQPKIELKTILLQVAQIIHKFNQYPKQIQTFKTLFYRLFTRFIELIKKQKKKSINKAQSILNQYHQIIQIIIYKAATKQKSNYVQALNTIFEKSRIYGKIGLIRIKEVEGLQNKYNSACWIKQDEFQYIIDYNEQKIKQKRDYEQNLNFQKRKREQIRIKSNQFLKGMDCMDIDLYECRCSIQGLKNNPGQQYESQIQRNYAIIKQINHYIKSYQHYQSKIFKKQQLHHLRKAVIQQNQSLNIQKHHYIKINPENYQHSVSQITTPKPKSKSIRILSRDYSEKYKKSQHHIKDSIRTQPNFSKKSKQQNVSSSPKKTVYEFNKIGIKPFYYDQKKKQEVYVNLRRKLKTMGNSRKSHIYQNSSGIIVQGKKICDVKIKCDGRIEKMYNSSNFNF